MAAVHRDTDSRSCGASTVTAQAKNVFANGLLISIDGDPNSHGGGALAAGSKNVFIGGTLVVNHTPDGAAPDALCPVAPPHCAPVTAQGSPDVNVGD